MQDMSIEEYKKWVKHLFASGKATLKMWEEMAAAVLEESEGQGRVPKIDEAVDAAVYREDSE